MSLIASEALLALALRVDLGPEPWRRARREYYMQFERHIVQYLPECAAFDPQLGYRLEPGRCRFANREFAHGIFVNSAGLRDREQALERPTIVVTGDSFSMGWGVADEQTLAAVLGDLTQERTLNAGQPSYGTARELLLLRRLDLSAAHTLVVQYCENDRIENEAFLANGARLPTMTEATYRALVRGHGDATRYAPGDHLRHLLPLVWRAMRDGASTSTTPDCAREARLFLDVLDRAELPARLRVIAFEATYTAQQPTCFARELTRLAAQRTLPGWISELGAIDLAPRLDAADYYPLDEHWNAAGTRKVAAAIAEAISPIRH